MTSEHQKSKRMHYDLFNVGLRAQAIAVGLVQLCIELRQANLLEEDALGRIKEAIADEVSVSGPRSMTSQEYREDIMIRLDKLFAGELKVGLAEVLADGPMQDDEVR